MDSGIINYAVYEDGKEYLGMANVQLPDQVNKKLTVNGAGIPGDIDIPVVGHKDAMTCKFTFTDVNEQTYKICETRRHLIDIRAAHEQYDSVSGEIKVVAYKHVMELIPTGRTSGTVSPSSMQGSSVDFSVLSVKDYIDGTLVNDFEPINFKDIDASGTDRLASVRTALGK